MVSAISALVAMAGVVDEVVEAVALPGLAQGGAQPLGEGGESRDVAGVELQGDGLAAHRLDLGDEPALGSARLW